MTDDTLAALAARVQVLEDIEAIRQLKAAYCRYLDGGWAEQGPTHMGPLADLFVEDGVWDGRPAAPRAEGRDAIRQMIVDYRVVPFIMHIVTNPVITVTGDEATGQWSAILPSTINGASGIGVGKYDEEYVRTADGWRFRSLRFALAGSVAHLSDWQAGARQMSGG